MRVLIGCEESQEVCKAFRQRGHEAYSCDLIDCSGGHPEWHIKDDIFHVVNSQWDLIILHPPCTALAVSGNRWYGKGMVKNSERLTAQKWTLELWERAKKNSMKVVLENPVGVLNKLLGNPSYVQPWQFGHAESKKTGFWLHGVKPLKETENVFEEFKVLPKNIAQRLHYLPPSEDRAKIRSKTFPGIAKAMSEQWG